MVRTLALICFVVILSSGCSTPTPIIKEVTVEQQVPITVEIPITVEVPVTREVVVEREIEVTREVIREIIITQLAETIETATPLMVTPVDLRQENLFEHLININDLPTGWIEKPATESSEFDNGGTFTYYCAELKARTSQGVSIYFNNKSLLQNLWLQNAIWIYPKDEGINAMADRAYAVQQCSEYTETKDDGTEFDCNISKMSFPMFGDETLTFHYSCSGSYKYSYDYVYIRFGDVIIKVGYGGSNDFAFDHEKTEEFVKLALNRLENPIHISSMSITPMVTILSTTKPSPTITPLATSTTTTTISALTTFGDGIWRVGEDISPGTYITTVPEDSLWCEWSRLSGFGGSNEEIIEEDTIFEPVQVIVTIHDTDIGFKSDGCGTWSLLE